MSNISKNTIAIANGITDTNSYRRAVDCANYHNYLYFVKAQPAIDDFTFDHLYNHIADYEAAHPSEILPDSPTQRVGSDLHSADHTIPHRTPMMSTQKAKTVEEVIKWIEQTNKRIARAEGNNPKDCGAYPYTIEWKYDGVSCSLVYQNGTLIEASTRGDYRFGKDILSHVLNIPSIPKHLLPGRRDDDGIWHQGGYGVSGRVEVRGEILLPFDHLSAFPSYSDTRTAAAALLNTDIPSPDKDSLLQFKAWQLITDDSCESWLISANTSSRNSLEALYDIFGFEVEEVDEVRTSTLAATIAAYASQRSTNPYPTDGLVIKVWNKNLWDALGRTEHHAKYSIAYKFPPATAITYCTSVYNTIGETGKVTPIAFFTPVTINGKQYSKASLGSERVALQLGIQPGAKIEVSLRNDVIPHVERVIK